MDSIEIHIQRCVKQGDVQARQKSIEQDQLSVKCEAFASLSLQTVVESIQRAYNTAARIMMYKTENDPGNKESQPPSTDGDYAFQHK